jgi:hypothetical protein
MILIQVIALVLVTCVQHSAHHFYRVHTDGAQIRWRFEEKVNEKGKNYFLLAMCINMILVVSTNLQPRK